MAYVDPNQTIIQRFEERHFVTEDGCWMWTGSIQSGGYGNLHYNGRYWRAHRLAYELFVGPIPEGMTLDHTCHTQESGCGGGSACLHRRCFNPEHLEPVSLQENLRRAFWNRKNLLGGASP